MLESLSDDKPVHLPEAPGWPLAAHLLDEMDVLAMRAAEAAGRPLLVRGEPGTGKTQLARAIAVQCECQLIPVVVNGTMELEDLFWRYDAVGRLADAQAMGSGLDAKVRADLLDQRRYVTPGPLWWAFDWTSAKAHAESWLSDRPQTTPYGRHTAPTGIVLLIDEIDKADQDLPNGLLEAFGQRSFRNPWVEDGVVSVSPVPLVTVITTNEERELPRAFLRRCLVRQLEYPDSESERDEFIQWLVRRARAHPLASDCSDDVLEHAAALIRQDRAGTQYGDVRPGLAEYLDLLRAVIALSPNDEAAQLRSVKDLSAFVISKQGKAY